MPDELLDAVKAARDTKPPYLRHVLADGQRLYDWCMALLEQVERAEAQILAELESPQP